MPVLGLSAAAVLDSRQAKPESVGMRFFIAARSRTAQDVADAAFAAGTRQVVVLGAGLDTFGLRHPGREVFEVDHPATQEWKIDRLREAGLEAPSVRFVGVDFEVDDLATRLAEAGHSASEPSCYLWLGVVPYLTEAAFRQTLAVTARAAGDEVVFDYAEPLDGHGSERTRRGARAAAVGEPWRFFATPEDVAGIASSAGFDVVQDLDGAALAGRLLGRVTSRRSGGHVVHASRRR